MSKTNQNIDEIVELVPHNQTWGTEFTTEALLLTQVFEPHRFIAIEHYGSTSVPGLLAKPILDILIGLDEFSLSEPEKKLFDRFGYEYIGRALMYERFFLRKRGIHNVNLAVVRHAGTVWKDSLAVRDYLRTHPQKATEYAQVKKQALAEGFTTTLDYAGYKHEFVKQLVQEARLWGKF